MDLLLAIEGGGSKTRLLLAGREGEILWREMGGSSSVLYAAPADLLNAMRPLLARATTAALEFNGTIRAVGLAGPMDFDLMTGLVHEALGEVPILIASEGDVAFECRGIAWGIALIAGTGVSSQVRTLHGADTTYGGFGPQFGDEGSGYWIARTAVSAVMLAEERRGTPTRLSEALHAHFGVESGWDLLPSADHCGHVSVPHIASFAPRVFQIAKTSDEVALGICAQAGRHLADLVLTSAQGQPWDASPIPLVCAGGVFGAGRLVLDPLEEALAAEPLAFALQPPVLEPADGLLSLLSRNDSGGA